MSTAELPPPADGGEPIHLTQSLVDEVESSFGAAEALLQSRANYFDSCKAFMHHPDSDSNFALLAAVRVHVDTFNLALEEQSTVTTTSEYSLFSHGLVKEDDSARVTFLNELTGRPLITPLEINIEGLREHLVTIDIDNLDCDFQESQRSVSKAFVTKALMAGIESDTNTFIEFAEDQPPTSRQKMLKFLGETTRDVGKIAAGTALALLITRRWIR